MSFCVVQFRDGELYGYKSFSTSEEALGEFCSLLRKSSRNGITFGVPSVLDVFTYVREWNAGDKAQSFALFGVPKSMVTPAIDWLNKEDAL